MRFNKNNKEINKNLLYIPIIILIINFLIRLINQSKMIKQFPLDSTNDWSSYIAQLFFLKECGFHNFCPYWYNGFITFKLVPPGWFFFSYIINIFTKDYLLTAFASMILIFLIGFIIIYKFGKKINLKNQKIILFFLLLFANASAIGNYIRLGRMPEFFAFMLFVLFAFIILYYKDKELDKNILFIIPLYSLLLISHQTFAILSSILWLSLLLVKNGKTRLKILLLIIISLIIDSFWIIPYVTSFYDSVGTTSSIGYNLLSFSKNYLLENIFSIIIPLIFLWILFIYLKNIKYKKKEILFFLPIIIIAILFLFRITAFLPILKYIYADVYMGFLLFFILFIFFKEFKINKKYFIGILMIVIISVLINVLYTPWFIEHTQLEKDTLEILKDVKTSFYMSNTYSETSYPKAYYSYASIYLNITTPTGWYKIPTIEYTNNLIKFKKSIEDKDCKELIKKSRYLNNDYLISFNNDCNFLKSCNLKRINQINNVCLYKFN